MEKLNQRSLKLKAGSDHVPP